MTSYEFIFSNKRSHRLSRHIAFWILFTSHFLIQNLMVGGVNEAVKPRTIEQSVVTAIYFIPIYFISTYTFIYLIIPRFLFPRKYTSFIITTTGLLLFNFIACYLSGMQYEHKEWGIPWSDINFESNKYHAIVNGLWVSFLFLGIAGGISISKKWLQKEKENEELARQKINKEIKLVKTQLHPNFLFHSLQTVQNHIKNNSDDSPTMILQLSDLLSYILYESEQQWAPLAKELEIIGHYIDLENKSNSYKGQACLEITGNASGKNVTPLLLLSVVEKCFEIQRLDNTSKNFTTLASINKTDIEFIISCHNTGNSGDNDVIKKRFSSIEKQLANISYGNHSFLIENENESVTITTVLPLTSEESPSIMNASKSAAI